MMNLVQFQRDVHAWSLKNFGLQPSYRQLLGVTEEIGELCHAHLKIEQGIRGATRNDIKDAVGDIVVYLADYCAQIGIDLSACIDAAWDEAKSRDWNKFPKNGLTK